MRVIGIDPGSRLLGWGVIERGRLAHNRLVHVASGTLRLPKGTLVQRLCAIADGLAEVLAAHQPAAACVEQVFFAKNSQSALVLGQARGVVLLSLARFGIDVFEYSATQIKQAATGSGRADKLQVQQMVRLVLGITQPADGRDLDTSDALAAAICHAQQASGALDRLTRMRGA